MRQVPKSAGCRDTGQETARRMKNYHHCFEHYNVLSDYFEKVSDLKSAMYFYQRCSDVATEVDALDELALPPVFGGFFCAGVFAAFPGVAVAAFDVGDGALLCTAAGGIKAPTPSCA